MLNKQTDNRCGLECSTCAHLNYRIELVDKNKTLYFCSIKTKLTGSGSKACDKWAPCRSTTKTN